MHPGANLDASLTNQPGVSWRRLTIIIQPNQKPRNHRTGFFVCPGKVTG